MNFNYKIINKEFENNKICVFIFKFSTLTYLKTILKFDSNSNLKIFNLQNNKFKQTFSNKIIIINMTCGHYKV